MQQKKNNNARQSGCSENQEGKKIKTTQERYYAKKVSRRYFF